MIFSGSALVVQLLLTSRILGFLGTFGGFLFHSMVTLMSSLSMLMGFGFFTTVMAKNNFEVSGIVSKNAYEASYYAFKHGTQKSIREFFEGFIAPAGTIVGTILLLLIRMFFIEKDSLLVINVLLVLLPVFALSISVYMQKCYTRMVRQNLFSSGKKIAKLHAIEILAQKGHTHAVDILVSALRMKEDADIHLKIIKVLRKIGDPGAIPAIEEQIGSEDANVAAAAINAMAVFPGIRKNKSGLMYTRQKLINDLKNLFYRRHEIVIRSAILRALPRLDLNAASYIIGALNHADPQLTAECMRQMSLSGDPAVTRYIKPYLDSGNSFIRANAVACLHHMKVHDARFNAVTHRLLASTAKEDVLAVCRVLWILRDKRIRTYMKKHLHSDDAEIRLCAAAGLLKCDDYAAAQMLADLLLEGNDLILIKAKEILKDLETGVRRVVAEHMKTGILRNAGLVIGKKMTSHEMFGIMGMQMLETLKKGYEALGAGEETELVKTIIEYRETRMGDGGAGLSLSSVKVI